MTLRALIFDVDGTLAETEEAHRAAFNAAFHQAGLDWHWDRATYGRLLTTTGGKERLARYRAEAGLDFVDPETLARLHKLKTAAYTRMLAQGALALRPGVQALIDQARGRGWGLALATTTSPANVEALCLAVWQKRPLQMFDAVAAGDEVAVKKPAPDVYRLALERLGLRPDQALAFEDSRNGVLSARAAGLEVIVTPSTYTMAEDFSGAARILPDLAGFDPEPMAQAG